MEGLLNELILTLGYIGVFLLMLLFATELVMPLAGFMAIDTGLWLPAVIIFGALGSTVGSTLMYYGGRFVPDERIHRLAARYGRYIGVSTASLQRAERWFDRHARVSVFVGKFAPGIRSASSFVAGYRHMPFIWFIVCTASATVISSTVFGLAGYLIGDNIEQLQRALSNVSMAARIALVIALIGFLVYRRKRYGKLLDRQSRRRP